MTLLQERLHWQKLVRSERVIQQRVAVLATFTANPLEPYLGLALEQIGLPAQIWLAPYNQVVQQCLDDASETARFQPTLLLCWVRLEELWSGRPLPLSESQVVFIDEALDVAEACLDAARRWQATLVFVLPAIPEERPLGVGDSCNMTGIFAVATSVREALRRRLAGQRQVLLIDAEEALRTLGSTSSYNQRLLYLAHIPFSEEFFHLLGERIARLIQVRTHPARKVIVLDGDNTLWRGVVGEDGPLRVDVSRNGPGEAYHAFQGFLLELRRAGMLLALCSKNDEADVREVFARREMRLKPEMFAAWRVGWQPKSASIREIAQELTLGIESFVFIDDNAAEIAEVQAEHPALACIHMPADPADWLGTMQRSGVFDRLPPTEEDLGRAAYYQQDRLRTLERSATASPAAYLAQLGIEVTIFQPTEADLPRVAQLVARTNQLNLNCRRRSPAELAQLCADPQYRVRLTYAQDRFGDYGSVGLCIARIKPDEVELDTFMLSCRAMGRGIEEAMLVDMLEVIAQHGREKLVAVVEACPRNAPAQLFFARFGCTIGVAQELHCVPWPSHIQRQQGRGAS